MIKSIMVNGTEALKMMVDGQKVWERSGDDGKLYLYKYGNECANVTGGWVTGWKCGSGWSQAKNQDNMYLHVCNGTDIQQAVSWVTNRPIDTFSYSKVCVLAKTNILSNTGFGFSIYVGNPATTWDEIRNTSNGGTAWGLKQELWAGQYKTHLPVTTTNTTVYTHEFLRSGNNYVNIADYGQNDWNIYAVWLE